MDFRLKANNRIYAICAFQVALILVVAFLVKTTEPIVYGSATLVAAILVTLVPLWIYSMLTQPALRLGSQLKGAVDKGDETALANLDFHDFGAHWETLVESIQKLHDSGSDLIAQLSRENSKLTSALSGMDVGVITIDQENRVEYVNNAAKRLLSIGSQDVINRSLYELVRHPTIESCVKHIFEEKTAIQEEFEPLHQDQQDLMVLEIHAVLQTREKSEVGILIIRDITNIHLLQNMRTDFVANVSHELKTPLASIKAYAETLKLGAIADKENRMGFVTRIEEQAQRLESLIGDLLELAKIESSSAIEIDDIDMQQAIEQNIDDHSRKAQKRGIELKTDITSEGSILVRAEHESVRTILDNLILNAIRHTQEGGRITINCIKSGSFAVTTVTDTGIGIAPEHHVRIFERFYRADKSRSTDLGGTGLGLSIVKHLCQSLGGEIRLTSALGKGTSLSFTLPLSESL